MESGRISIGKSAAVDLKQTHRKDAEGAAYHHTDQKQDPRIHLFLRFCFLKSFGRVPMVLPLEKGSYAELPKK